MTAAITVTPKTHWLNGWFLRAFARPYVVIDDAEHKARWGQAHRIEVAPGRRTVGVGVRYLRASALLGTEAIGVNLQPSEHVRLTAQNGPLNHQPFALRISA